MPAPSKEILLKIAAEHPDLVDLIEPMLTKTADSSITVEDLELEMYLINDLIRTLKTNIPQSSMEPRKISYELASLKTELENIKSNLMRTVKKVRG